MRSWAGDVTRTGVIAAIAAVAVHSSCVPDKVLRGDRLDGPDAALGGEPSPIAGAGGADASPASPGGGAGNPGLPQAGASGGQLGLDASVGGASAGRDAAVTMPTEAGVVTPVDTAPLPWDGSPPGCRPTGDGRLLDLTATGPVLPATAAHPAGVWRPAVDGTNGVIGFTVETSDPQLCSRPTALRFRGSGFTAWGAVAQGFWDAGPVDVAAFAGVRVSLRAAAPLSLRLKIADRQSHHSGGVCTRCDDAFGAELLVGGTWREYTIPFASMRQEGWGTPQFFSIDRTRIIGVELLVRQNQVFDVWIGDVALYK